MMVPKFVTKRSHKKSRAGCQTCKSRKIKCDEAQPSCTFCALRKNPCNYPPRPQRSVFPSLEDSGSLVTISGNNSEVSSRGNEDIFISLNLSKALMPLVMSASGGLSTTDLGLMHHWSTFTWDSILPWGQGDMNSVLRFKLPELSFENDFLMKGMLGLASLHRRMLLPDPGNAQKETYFYRAKALEGFRAVISQVSPESKNYEAALLMSVLIVVLCSQDNNTSDDELTVVHWLTLFRGLAVILLMGYPSRIPELSVSPLFRRSITELNSVPLVPTALMNMLASVHPLDPDYDQIEIYCKILDVVGMLYASLRQDGIGPALFVRVVTWPSFASPEFVKLAKEKRPRALIILAYYLVFLKLIEGVWWIEGIPDREIEAISRIVGPEWNFYLDVPQHAAKMTNNEEIARLLLM